MERVVLTELKVGSFVTNNVWEGEENRIFGYIVKVIGAHVIVRLTTGLEVKKQLSDLETA